MFEVDPLSRCTSHQLLDAAAANRRACLEADNEKLLIAAAWADDQDRGADPTSAKVQRSSIDGDGDRPQIDEDAVCELGAVFGLGFVSARNLIDDAVSIRHRLPQLWAMVRAAAAPAWQIRKVAQATLSLTYDQCAEVDAQLAGVIGLLPWPRTAKILAAAVLTADPEAAVAREERARTERFVRAFDSENGLKTLVARATSGDVTWFMAAIDRIADILAAQGDTDPADVLRSRAVGILAHPTEALRVLASGIGTGSGPAAEPGERTEVDEGAEFVPATPDPATQAECTWQSMPTIAPHDVDLNARSLRPRTVLYFHLSEAAIRTSDSGALVRPEHGSALTLLQLKRFLADTGCVVTVRPVVTPADESPIDAYEIPSRIREAVRMRNLVDVFPYGSCDLRGMDLDHTIPYDPGGPPGQTGLDNLGPLGRTSHRASTPRIGPGGRITGRWQKRQPDPGSFVWRSPHGWVYLTNNHGTFNLGTGSFAQRVWAQACPTFVRAA